MPLIAGTSPASRLGRGWALERDQTCKTIHTDFQAVLYRKRQGLGGVLPVMRQAAGVLHGPTCLPGYISSYLITAKSYSRYFIIAKSYARVPWPVQHASVSPTVRCRPARPMGRVRTEGQPVATEVWHSRHQPGTQYACI